MLYKVGRVQCHLYKTDHEGVRCGVREADCTMPVGYLISAIYPCPDMGRDRAQGQEKRSGFWKTESANIRPPKGWMKWAPAR